MARERRRRSSAFRALPASAGDGARPRTTDGAADGPPAAGYLRNLLVVLSASTLPPVWHVGQ